MLAPSQLDGGALRASREVNASGGASEHGMAARMVKASDRARDELYAALRKALPLAILVRAPARSADEDFYRMVHAPLLLTAAGSYAIAAAIAAYGKVRTPASKNWRHPEGEQLPPTVMCAESGGLCSNWSTFAYSMDRSEANLTASARPGAGR